MCYEDRNVDEVSTEAKDRDVLSFPAILAQNKDNEKDFHAQRPESTANMRKQPLYLEMTFPKSLAPL
ncbi:hypothetical protein JCM39068_32640 [Desulfocastanea catecholica]